MRIKFTDLVEHNRELLKDFVLLLVKDSARATIIANICLIDIYGRMDDFESEQNAKSYLFNLAKQKCERYLNSWLEQQGHSSDTAGISILAPKG